MADAGTGRQAAARLFECGENVLNESDPGTQDTSTGPLAFVRRHRVPIVIVLVLLLGGAWFLHRARQQNAANVRPTGFFNRNNAVAVAVATVKRGDVAIRIPAIGTVTALTTVTLRTQISGVMEKVNFTEGQMVKKGQLIALVDPRPYEAALAQAKANLARDEALLANARLDMKRYEDLIKEDSVSQQQVDTQRATVAQDEGTVASDRAAIQTAEVNLIYTRVTSPVDGRIGLRQVDPGNYVTPGDANGIVVVTQLHPISVLFVVPEDKVPSIMRQLKAGEKLAAAANTRDNQEHLADGVLSNTDTQIDVTTGTLKLRAEFDNSDGALFPGQFVNISLLVTTLKDQLLVPAAAIRRGAPDGIQGAFVYLLNSNNTVSVRSVELGVTDGEIQAVKSGLHVDDVVVTDGGDRLRDGAAVQLPDATAAEVAKARAQAQAAHQNEAKFPNRRSRNGQGGFGPPGGRRPPGGGPP